MGRPSRRRARARDPRCAHPVDPGETACAQADQNASLENALKEDGLTVRGAAGQSRLNAAATELRQGRLALAKLLDQACLERVQRPPEPEFNDDPLPAWLRPEEED